MFRSSFLSRMAPCAMLLNKGRVVSWMNGRGFGFIEDDADKKQHFVHFTALQTEAGGFRALSVGQEVEFEVASQDGRTRAENVTSPGGAKLPSGTRPPPSRDGGFGGRGRGRGRGGDFNRRPRRDDGFENSGSRGNNNGGGNYSDEF